MPEIDITRIAGNIGAMNALNSLQGINKQLAIYQTRLATGKRINSAADDPAGLSIASKLQARSEGLKVALGNIGDAKNLLAVAESGLSRINDILLQMRNKAAQAASDTMGDSERTIIKTQLAAYAKQIDDIVGQTKWNDKELLKQLTTALRFQTGADAGDKVEFEGVSSDLTASGLGLGTVAGTASVSSGLGADLTTVAAQSGLTELESGTYQIYLNNNGASSSVQLFRNGQLVTISDGSGGTATSQTVDLSGAATVDFGVGVQWALDGSETSGFYQFTYTRAGDYTLSASSAAEFATYLGTVETAMNTVNTEMSNLGSLIGRLSFKEDQVAAAQINVEAAYNRIMNANMAEEQVNASKYLILQQTATAMLAQANTAPQFLLSLFR
ncbi:MAG: flagellin [Chloroflexota bacterium]|nr:MAG: flagellin [Bellilinea sp.]